MKKLLTRPPGLGKVTRYVSALALTFCLLASPARALDRQGYADALSALDRGQTASALTLAKRQQGGILDDVLAWKLMARDDAPYNFDAYAAALTAYPDWPGQSAVRRQAEQRLPDKLSPAATLEFFGTHEPLTPEGLTRYAGALVSTGHHDGAEYAVKSFWREARMTGPEQKAYLDRYRGMLDSADLAARAATLVGRDETTLANQILPRLPNAEQAVLKARLALRGAQKGNVDALVAAVPSSRRDDPGLTYDRARWRRARDNTSGTAELLRTPAHGGGLDASKWWKLREDVARDLLENGSVSLAYTVASRHGLPASEGVAYTELEWLAGWIALEHQTKPDTGKAFAHFQNTYNGGKSVNTRSKAAYWSARALARSGDDAGARQWFDTAARLYGNTFYGQSAALELYGEVNIKAPPDTPVDSLEQKRFGGRSIVKAIRALSDIGARKEALRFARALMEEGDTARDFALIAALGEDLEKPEISAFAGKIAGRNGHTLGKIAYPTLPARFNRLAERIGTSFAHAIVWQESAFNPEAKSGAGAEGLMQLMPATARLEEKKLGLGKGSLSNPQHNLDLGTSHMHGLLARFNGSMPKAIAGYNAGANRPARWSERFVTCKADTAAHATINWIESIPFGETRDYVKYVMAAAKVYDAVLNRGSAPLTLHAQLEKGEGCPQLARAGSSNAISPN